MKSLSIGLDISDDTIELVAARRKGKDVSFEVALHKAVPKGSIKQGRIKKPEIVKKFLHDVFSEAERLGEIKIKDINLILPDSAVFTHVFRYDHAYIEKESLEEAVPKSIQKIVPLRPQELRYMYTVQKETKEMTDVLVIATSSKVLDQWQSMLASLHVSIKYLDTVSLAHARELFPKVTEPTAVIDCGASSTTLTILDSSGLRYSQQIYMAGNAITDGIASALGMSVDEAEQLKVSQGMTSGADDYKTAVADVVQKIGAELQKNLIHFEQFYTEEITSTHVTGGTAYLTGFTEYLDSILKRSLKLATPRFSVGHVDLLYVAAAGSARRGLESTYGLSLSFKQLDEVAEKQPKKKRKSTKRMDDQEGKSVKKQIIILVTILVLGALLIVAAWSAKNNDAVSESDAARQQSLDQLEQLPE
ncbi:MAG: pilus assembly protein PilM [Patescibacteria group bacterium]